MLLIIDVLSQSENFPVEALKEVDTALATLGFKKEVHSVVKPGKQYSLTYDGSRIDKDRIEEILRPVGEKNQIKMMVEFEESVKFP